MFYVFNRYFFLIRLAEQNVRKGIFYIGLHGPLDRTCAVLGIKTLLYELGDHLGRNTQLVSLRLEPLLQQPDLDTHDLPDGLAAQGFECHHIVNPVDKLRRELLLQRFDECLVDLFLAHLAGIETHTAAELL